MYSLPHIMRVIKSRKFGQTGHVAKVEEGSALKNFTDQPAGKIRLEMHRYI